MTKEELRAHCEKQIRACEMWAHSQGERPCGKVYEEHKLILDLIKTLEQQSDDCVSRKAMLNAITEIDNNVNMDIYTNEVREIIKALPPVTPTHGTCKECKYSSVHTISLDKIDKIRVCRIQFSKQIKDDYYCANYEKRGNENESIN